MRNFIAAVSLAAFTSVFAHADDSYFPESESPESEQPAAGGDSAQPDGESTSDEQTDAPAPRELDV